MHHAEKYHHQSKLHQAFIPQTTLDKLLLKSRPAEGRRLNWPQHTVGQQLAQSCLQWIRLASNRQSFDSATPLSISANQKHVSLLAAFKVIIRRFNKLIGDVTDSQYAAQDNPEVHHIFFFYFYKVVCARIKDDTELIVSSTVSEIRVQISEELTVSSKLNCFICYGPRT